MINLDRIRHHRLESDPYAVWTYEAPYAAVADIRGPVAFYPDRIGTIEERVA